MADTYYYHAGVGRGDTVLWSNHTRRSLEVAEQEARRMAAGDCGLVAGAQEVQR